MHPAYSVIFFTTATGAGYGLLVMLGIAAPLGIVPPDLWLGLVGFGLAFGLISLGLIASTGHLGRPERAWRAFSQWRSSWLSREGVAAVVTYAPAGFFAIGWVIFRRTDSLFAVAGIVTAVCAALTVSATAMIYASLKPVAQWSSRFTVPAYLIFALMTGSVLFNALTRGFGVGSVSLTAIACAVTILGWVWKEATWRYNDALGMPTTVNSATGLVGGKVYSIEQPHTEENYILKEMGYRIARKHSTDLRMFVRGAAFALPIVLLLAALVSPMGVAAILSALATVLQLAGMLTERWLFFAEAKHTVMLYYGR